MSNSGYDILLASPDLRGNERDYIEQCLADNWISTAGPFVERFEARVAELLDRRFAVATSSGTAALEIALIGAGVKRGDIVVLPDWTFAATATAAYHAGAELFLADVSMNGLGLDPEDLDAALTRLTREGRPATAVIVVHPFGYPADLDSLLEVCTRHRVKLIEDAAGAIGTHYKGVHVGRQGIVSAFSFNGNKTVTTGGGGIALTDDPQIYAAMRTHSANSHGPNYHYAAIGYNHRMTNLAAAIGMAQLERLDEMIANKKSIAARYDEALLETACLDLIRPPDWANPNRWMYCAYVRTEKVAQSLINFMRFNRIQVRIFWRSLASQPAFSAVQTTNLVNSQSISGRVVALPCSSHLSPEDQGRVIAALRDWQLSHQGES